MVEVLSFLAKKHGVDHQGNAVPSYIFVVSMKDFNKLIFIYNHFCTYTYISLHFSARQLLKYISKKSNITIKHTIIMN